MMHRIILRAAFFTFIGCNNPKIEVEKLPTPETFNDSQPSLKIASRYYDYGDLIQELYAELVLNEKEIGAFEDHRLNYKKKLLKAEESFENYHIHSEEYYATAKQYALLIQDSTYSNALFKSIEVSENKYRTSISSLENAIRLLNIEDSLFHHRLIGLQVELTLKMMEIFQENEIPKLEKFESLSEIQKALNQELKAINAARN